MKKFLFALFLLPALCFVSCSNDDDEPNEPISDGSNWVEIGGKKFSPKYGYITLADDERSAYQVLCSDTDLTDMLLGKPFKKQVSVISFSYDGNVGTSDVEAIFGYYKAIVDSSAEDEDVYFSDKDGCIFIWSPNYAAYNPEGSSYKFNVKGNTHHYEGNALMAAWNNDGLDEDMVGFKALSFSVTMDFVNLDTKSVRYQVISDPSQVNKLRSVSFIEK